MQYLRGKTIVIITHAIDYTKYFDYIYMMEKGQIIREGTYPELRDYLHIIHNLEEEDYNSW